MNPDQVKRPGLEKIDAQQRQITQSVGRRRPGNVIFEALFTNNHTINLIIDPLTGRITNANKAACNFYGYSEREFTAMNIMQINGVSEKEYKKGIREIITGKQNHFYLTHRLKNGDIRDVEVYTGKIILHHQEYLFSVIHDITRLKQYEAELYQKNRLLKEQNESLNNHLMKIQRINEELLRLKMESESREIQLKAISEQAMDGITLADSEGNYLFVNKAFCNMTGYSEYELLGMSVFDLKPKEDKAHFFEDTKRIGVSTITNKRLQKKDGTIFFADINGKKISIGNEERILGIVRDVTERVLAENMIIRAKDKAEESDRLKTAFLHNISHEIRTPLNSILGFSEILKKSLNDDTKRSNYIDIIGRSGHNLANIIDDIVRIATIEAGQEKVTEEKTDINKLCYEIYNQFDLTARKQGLDLQVNTPLPFNQAIIITDPTKLFQILCNLLNNAIKFTRKGFVHFGYLSGNELLEFYVKDSGIGIRQDMHEEIFKRFRQVEINDSKEFGGSGLGLSISKAYVEMLGGKLWLTSEPDRGSRFYFTIPFKNYNPT